MKVQFPQSALSIALAAALAMGSGLAMAQSSSGSSSSDSATQTMPGSSGTSGTSEAGSAPGTSGPDSMSGASDAQGAGSESAEDQQISSKVKQKLASEGVDESGVTVHTQDGVVTISGLGSDADKDKIKKAVKDVDGVKDVKMSGGSASSK